MKKILFATTALVASASFASAEVKLTGYAEIGIKGGSGIETQFHDDIDVSFYLSGETDNGLTFGAKIDLDEADVGAFTGGPTQLNAVWVKGAFGSITLGDTDGALDWAMQEVGMGTTLTDEHTSHAGYNGNSGLDGTYDGQVLRYDNTFGDFGVAISAELDDTGVGDVDYGIGVKYNAALGGVNLGLGLGYQDNGVADIWGVSVDAKMDNGFRAILNYSDHSVAGAHYAIGLGYTMDALLVTANYGKYDLTGNDAVALAVNYDLGGGATVMAGYTNDIDGTTIGDQNRWSIGLGLSF